jgi:hypothetical protein
VSEIKITEWTSDVLGIELPGLTAVRVDTARRIIAIDCISGSGQVGREWSVADLRGSTYGDFHRLKPAVECFDAACAGSGEHAIPPPVPDLEEG